MCDSPVTMNDTLNDLITTSLDGVHGYKQAADHASDAGLKAMLTDLSAQRATFASELQGLVRQMGGTPTDDGSVAAAFHRGWIGLKDALTGGDKAVVGECVRGDEHAKKAYEDALAGGDVPAAAGTLLTTQHGQIAQAIAQLQAKHQQMA